MKAEDVIMLEEEGTMKAEEVVILVENRIEVESVILICGFNGFELVMITLVINETQLSRLSSDLSMIALDIR